MVGFASRLIVTSSNVEGHVPFVVVQRKIFAPTDNPLTADVGDVGVTIVPVPEINVHVPVPVVGVFPANVVEAEQSV
jgi:hypothetical protein